MKNVRYLIAAFLLTGVTAFATTTSNLDINTHATTFVRGYGNSFIFVEQGVEFAVFPDGQFDFNVNSYGPDFNAYANFGGVSISFNTGHSYDAYVQYDDYGAVVQIENVPIYYDYYGRIVRAGNVRIHYNRYGRISRVGGLFVHYNRYNAYSHYTGYINVYNRHYVYRSWHTYYAAPIIDFCIVFNKPYRRYYNSVRHDYYRPYSNNYRPNVSYSASRRGSVAYNKTTRSDRYRQSSKLSRRDNSLNKGRRITSVDNQSRSRDRSISKRTTSKPRVINRSGNKAIKPRTVKRNNTVKPRTVKRSNTVKPRVNSKPRTTSRPRVANTQTKRKTNTVKPRTQSKKSSRSGSEKRVSQTLRHKSRATTSKKSNSRTSKRRH